MLHQNHLLREGKILKSHISNSSNVILGKHVIVEDYCVLGKEPKSSSRQRQTTIGNYGLIRSHSVIYAGTKIGSHFQTGHGVLIRDGCLIGSDVSVGSHSIIEHNARIGSKVRIHSNVFIPEYTHLEESSWIGPGVIFTNSKYPVSTNSKQHLKGVIVKKGAKIGAGAVILPGIVIGEHVLVGAGSVVTKNVEKYKIVVGNPAQVIGDTKSLKHPTGENAYLYGTE